MDEKQQLMDLYKEFMYTKENFVNRSFATNKFYIIAVTLCLFALAAIKEYGNSTGSVLVVAIAIAGFAFSFLLWANQDAYTYLLKIKFGNVIDKMEEAFCFKPCVEEKTALVENAQKKRNYVFTDIQKTFALATMVIFTAAFFWDIVPIALNNWFSNII